MFIDVAITSLLTHCLHFTRWKHIANMARMDPSSLMRYSIQNRSGDPLPDKLRWADQTPAIGLMAIVVEECEVVTPGHVQTGPRDSYRVRRLTGLPFMGAWELDCSIWGTVLKFSAPVYGPVCPGISFLSQGEGKGMYRSHLLDECSQFFFI
jgi:hypothetical protein